MNFEEWMQEVNKHLKNLYDDLDEWDFIDCPFRDWYNADILPKVAAERTKLYVKDATL